MAIHRRWVTKGFRFSTSWAKVAKNRADCGGRNGIFPASAIRIETRKGHRVSSTVFATNRKFGWVLAGVSALVLTACERELILPGERFDARTPIAETLDPANSLGDATIETVEQAAGPRAAVPINLPATRNLTAWTHRNSDVTHRAGHPALARVLTQVWSAEIGQGDSRKHRITATPVAENGRVFTLDALAQVTATSANDGATIWTHDVTPDGDRKGDASGGGLSLGAGSLFVTSGFGTITAIDPATGAVKWTHNLEAAASAPATVSGSSVYVVTTDGVARALDVATGRQLWVITGAPNITGLTGGSGPAIAGRTVIMPLGSGELLGVLKTSGIRAWGTSVAGERRGRGYTVFSDITGDPVVAGGTVYAGNAQGKLAAIETRTGDRIWTAGEGALGPVWPAGDSLFLVNDQGQLVRLNASTGAVIWAEQMPYFLNEKPRRRRGINAHFGPVLAGGRLLVASDDGMMRGYDPASGALMDVTEIPGGAATAPIVVNGTAFVVTTRGTLLALR